MTTNDRPTIHSHRLMLEKEILSDGDGETDSGYDSLSDDPQIVLLPADTNKNETRPCEAFIISPNKHVDIPLSDDLPNQNSIASFREHHSNILWFFRQMISSFHRKWKRIIIPKSTKITSLDECSQSFKIQIREIIRLEIKKELYGDDNSSSCINSASNNAEVGIHSFGQRANSFNVQSCNIPRDQILCYLEEELK